MSNITDENLKSNSSEVMRNKQIEEMADDVRRIRESYFGQADYLFAMKLYEDGYRKQSEGEWKRIEVNGENYGQVYYQHKDCKVNETQLFPSPYHFCPNCGAKMRKEDEGK